MKTELMKSLIRQLAIHCRLCMISVMVLSAMIPATCPRLMAQSTPRWVEKGVKELDKKRSNNTYEFWVYHNHGQDILKIEEEARNSLMEYVGKNYYADSIEIKMISESPYRTYEVQFTNVSGKRTSVLAELIDTYSRFDDFEYNVFEYEYYQLYAVSKPGIIPMFDDFTLTRKYNSLAVVKSIIPGMGQIYKGQKTKGQVIIGGEIFLIGAGLIFNYKAHDARKMRDIEPEFASSWRSKQHAWMNFRLGAFASAGVLYVANLLDAAISKGATQVVVSKPKSQYFSLQPYASFDGMGMSVRYTF
ncbi:MAG: hypothetical protein K2K05_06250 [Muribaculaceae bacterium]|nr:hypothetical protein [Muribaculaceae bacterium]